MQNTGSTVNPIAIGSSAFNMPRKILFIVNPNAGKRNSDRIVDAIRKEFPQNIYYEIVIWKDKDHFDEITELLKTQSYTDAVAVGGDGTVNHVAKTIVNSNIVLGIIPIGSGNGLARSLGLSMNIEEVIDQIAVGRTASIDSGTVNGIPFFCTSGLGFDAHIGNLFASSTKRGLLSYVKITIAQLFKYRSKNYTLQFNEHTIQRKAFLITVANAGQYGNDFYIAPDANMQDGLFHVVILKPFNAFQALGLFARIMQKKANLSSCIETYITDEITITREHNDPIHFDGEPVQEKEVVSFVNKRSSLRVIVGEKFEKTNSEI